MPHVSVIIPAHNAELFVRAAVASALAQTHTDLEVVVVDDGSSDGTAAALASFGDRIRVLQQAQGGPAKARNLGASAARGTWLAFLDADDTWLPRKLERQLALADDTIGLVYSDRYNTGSRGSLPEIQSDIQQMYEGRVFLDLLLGNVITTSSVLIRRSIFDAIGGFSEDPSLPPAEDWDLWLRFAAEHQVRVCHEPLVGYRIHAASASQNPDRMNRARLRVVERALQLPSGRALSPAMRRRVWAATYATNGWDAGRHAKHKTAIGYYARAIEQWPFDRGPYRELLKACLGRS